MVVFITSYIFNASDGCYRVFVSGCVHYLRSDPTGTARSSLNIRIWRQRDSDGAAFELLYQLIALRQPHEREKEVNASGGGGRSRWNRLLRAHSSRRRSTCVAW